MKCCYVSRHGSIYCSKQTKKVAIPALIASSWPEQYLLPTGPEVDVATCLGLDRPDTMLETLGDDCDSRLLELS